MLSGSWKHYDVLNDENATVGSADEGGSDIIMRKKILMMIVRMRVMMLSVPHVPLCNSSSQSSQSSLKSGSDHVKVSLCPIVLMPTNGILRGGECLL
jgi:hypothetical protein